MAEYEYLRVWLRCCTIFGIYVSSRSEHALREASQRQPTQRRAVWLSEPLIITFVLERMYVALLALIACTLYVHGLYARKIEDGLALTWLVATLVYTTQLLTHLAIFMEALWKRVENETFLQLLAEIEVSLQLRLNCDTRQHALRQSLRRWLLGLVTLSLVGFVIFTSVSVLLNDIGYLWHAAFSLLTLRMRILQLLLYACILRHYMECLCFKLRQLVAYRTAPERRVLDVNYEKLESLTFLLAFKENYALIFKAVGLFNNFAGWSLFGIIFGYMLDFTCHVYWSLLGLDGYGSRYTFVVGLPAVLPFSVIVWQLCFVCDQCKELVCSSVLL